MWLMLQQDKPDDYVVATGETRTVREFVNAAFAADGMQLEWHGTGVDEYAVNTANGKTVVTVNPKFFRPAEVELLIGDPTKAETKLGWKREIDFNELVSRMAKHDMELVSHE